MATRMDAAAVVLAGLIAFAALAGPALPLWKLTIQLPSIPFLLGLLALVVCRPALVFRGTTVWDTVAVWRERLDRRPDVAAALRAFVATRPAVFLVAYFAVVTFGLAPTASRILSPDPLANLPVRFDAGWYGSIAMDGYQWDGRFTQQANIAFFPALPALMQPVGQMIGSRAPGVTRERRDASHPVGRRVHLARGVLRRADLRVAAEPAARRRRALPRGRRCCSPPIPSPCSSTRRTRRGCSFSPPSAPSITFIGEQWVAASLFGLLVGPEPSERMLRVGAAGDPGSTGDLFAMEERSGQGVPGVASRALPRSGCSSRRCPASPCWRSQPTCAGIIGVWFAWARMQEAWGRTLSMRPLAQGWEWLTTEGLMAVTRGVPFDTLNTLAVLFVLAMFWSVLRRLGFAYATFVALNLFPPVFTGGALSMGRMTSTLFPVFIALAARLPRQAIPVWVTAFAVLQGLVAALFFTWRELF